MKTGCEIHRFRRNFIAIFLLLCILPWADNSLLNDARAQTEQPSELKSKSVEIGFTQDQVIAALGKPKGKMTVKGETVWTYDKGDVIFKNGKVTSCDMYSEAQMDRKAEERERVAAERRKQEDEIKALLKDSSGLPTRWQDDKSATVSMIQCSFALSYPSGSKASDYRKSGRVPFRITATVWAGKQSPSSKSTLEIVKTGNVAIRIFDENANQILNTSLSADKMCPS